MKWILIAAVLDGQMVYNDQETCQLAAAELQKVYYQEVAACIPQPVQVTAEDRMNSMMNQFLEMVREMQKLEQKTVDNTNK
jgi:hypothetical protein